MSAHLLSMMYTHVSGAHLYIKVGVVQRAEITAVEQLNGVRGKAIDLYTVKNFGRKRDSRGEFTEGNRLLGAALIIKHVSKVLLKSQLYNARP